MTATDRPAVPPVPREALRDLRHRLDAVTWRDAARLGRRLHELEHPARRRSSSGRRRPPDPEAELRRLETSVASAEQLVARRVAALPTISYPPALPVSERRDDIAAAIRDSQVVVVAGETGSGKTTQLPKICLELGRGIRGAIGHTQPRRLAARSVAERIAEELGTPLGQAVGYSVRFTDEVSDRTLVKLMTDGILLAELQRDRRLLRYDTLIIDEAHERSLNIDFLLGYLVELLPRRPELKVVVTSATIDPGRFAEHFSRPGAPVPVVEASGRTFPVEIRYRPLVPDAVAPGAPQDDDVDEDDAAGPQARDRTEGIVDAVRELSAAGPGDVLVFLSGEREIRDTAEVLRGLDLPSTEVVPLYARLSAAEQHRVFEPHEGRRIVLSTNVAETSLTVPGIRYVIDPGTARISRYSLRTKVQRLPIEPVSQASANQRAGRCGRVAEGICIRLYSEADYLSRPRFTDPEVQRTNLASVILQMAALDLGDIGSFAFLDPPDRRSVRDGVALLEELGALQEGSLTPVGRRLAALPVDPRLARMIVAAQEEGCVNEVLVLAAALSIPDPRERPTDPPAAARAAQLHARFADEHSDFTGLLNLWTYLREQRSELSGNRFRRMCRDEYLHYLRIREWQDLHGQLRSIAAGLGISEAVREEPASAASVHAALVPGLLSHVGMQDGREPRTFLGARNSRFVIALGSVLARRPPAWVVAAELVETSRLFARVAARIDPAEVERHAGHLVARTYSEPHWDRRRGAVTAYERVTLYGLPLVTRRRVDYARIDPAVSRELFLRSALVEGEWDTRHRFLRANTQLLEELRGLEDRVRRRDVLITDDELYDWYDARVPPDVVSARHFDAWWKRARVEQPDLLTLTREDALRREVDGGHPAVWTSGSGAALPVSYRFEPGAEDDGVTVHVPLDALARLGGAEFGWQVPALREELVTELIRSLPKPLRRVFVPVPDTARAVLAALPAGDEPLLPALQRELHHRTGVLVPLDAFDLDRVPAHLRVTFVVQDAEGRELARGKDVEELRRRLAEPVRAAVAEAVATSGPDVERSGLTDWPADLDEIPRSIATTRGGHPVEGWPALVVAGDAVDLRVLTSQAEQARAMPLAQRALLRRTVASPARAVLGGVDARTRLVLATNPDGGPAELVADCADAAVDVLLARHGGPAWTRADFDALRREVRAELVDVTGGVLADALRALRVLHEVQAALPGHDRPAERDAVADVTAQLRRLLPPGFVTRTGAGRLRDLTRYLQAVLRRLERLPREADVDRARMQRVAVVEQALDDLVRALPPERSAAEDVAEIRRQVEELRVSLFAQQLGTPRPVSEQRILRAVDLVVP